MYRKNLGSLRRLGHHHTYGTRHRDVVEITVHRTARYESGPLYRELKIYDMLPDVVKGAGDDKQFSRALKGFLVEKCL